MVRMDTSLFFFFVIFLYAGIALAGPEVPLEAEPSLVEPVEWKESLEKLRSRFELGPDGPAVIVDISEQKLYLLQGGNLRKTYPVSTSRHGLGSKEKSHKTPLGAHRIAEKIGGGAGIGAVFREGIELGKVAIIHVDDTDLREDLITTRILWLKGIEPGVNLGERIDSYERHIYIHGTPEEGLIGAPASDGCIRMKNRDVVELFDLVPEGALVEIQK